MIGTADGRADGAPEGGADGRADGAPEGGADGGTDGKADGSLLGSIVGILVGTIVGIQSPESYLLLSVGLSVGVSVAEVVDVLFALTSTSAFAYLPRAPLSRLPNKRAHNRISPLEHSFLHKPASRALAAALVASDAAICSLVTTKSSFTAPLSLIAVVSFTMSFTAALKTEAA